MRSNNAILAPAERDELDLTVLVRQQLEEQFEDLDQQHEVASLGMWIFLATEVMFFGTLFIGLAVYRYQYPVEFERGSERLNWLIGGVNTVVLLISSLMMVLAVHHAREGRRGRVMGYLSLTALLGLGFLVLKAMEYYLDYRDNLIPGWKFVDQEWIDAGLTADQVPHVKLFLTFYWVMTALHALHMILGIAAVLTMLVLTWRGCFSAAYYSPIDVTGLYWHFVDTVWIFLLPMLYLLGTHSLRDLPW